MKIGLTMRIIENEKYYEPRDAISHDWIIYLQDTNNIPFILPNGIKDVKSYLENINLDCIILSGGDNIIVDENDKNSPKYLRDKSEIEIIQYCIDNRKPLIGICRGMQLLNHFFNGNNFKLDNSKNHIAKEHLIKWKNNELIKDFPTLSNFLVNSYHEQGISLTTLGSKLIPIAYDERDNIEAFYHHNLPIVGIMWHPERKFSDYEVDNFHKKKFFNLIWKIFNLLVKE